MIDIHIAKDEAEKKLCYQIRHEVFVRGQNISAGLDTDGLDDEAEHAIVYKDGKPVGCARIRYAENKMKLERIAVLEKMRGQGLGQELMKFLINYAESQDKVKGIVMSSQQYLEKYYQRFGFQAIGESYKEVGIPHIKMYRANR